MSVGLVSSRGRTESLRCTRGESLEERLASYLAGFPKFTEALCAQVDPEMFFPEKGGSTAKAKGICGRCADRDMCREFAVSRPDVDGIWGGTTPRKRQEIRSGRSSTPVLSIRERVALRSEAAVV